MPNWTTINRETRGINILKSIELREDRYLSTMVIECVDFREENRRLARLLVKRGYLTTGEDCHMPTNFNDYCGDYRDD